MASGYGSTWSAGFQRGTDAHLGDWLRFALAACDAADAISLPAFLGELEVTAKSDGSFVTQADRAVERAIRERIADAYPAHGVVGEEYGLEDGQGVARWYIDPIDGTHNFMRRVPLYGTLLALEVEGELQVAVCSSPALARRWWASRGQGTWVTEPGSSGPRRLHVSDITRIAESQLVFRSILDMRGSSVADGFESLLTSVWRQRGFGDFWGYTLVADGSAEMMMERELHPWDLAAPCVLVEEAGGRITDFAGRRDWHTPEALATNGLLHEEILARLAGRAGAADVSG